MGSKRITISSPRAARVRRQDRCKPCGREVGAIGRRLFLGSGTLKPLLKRLEAAGLVTRRRHPADERQMRVRLTARGDAPRGRARGLPHAIACAMGRSGEEIAVLRDDLLRLRVTLMTALDGHPADAAAPAT